jgi:GH15 family glucan-1,4-alpha-glucosidase
MTETAIADHGLIGDLQTAALISTDGSIDWFCCPRFDSPSVFGALLDNERGGHFRVRPARGEYETKQMYFPDTAVLITRYITEAGVGEVVDFMPPSTGEATANHCLVRMLRCVRGEMSFEVNVAPRFDYGRKTHRTDLTEHGAVFTTDALTLTLHPVREPDDARLAHVRIDEGDLRVSIELTAGDVRGLVLEAAADGPPREIRVAEFQRLFDDTVAFWRSWLSRSTYMGRWRETIQRSAITLKLMTYAPTGGLVAAPTTGLPEQVGGERNWDYRYTWVRDASFSIYALLRLGFTEESAQFSRWLRDRVTERAGGEGGPLNIMYRVGLSRLAPGPDRQRRLRPGPARHLRRGAGQHLLRRPARVAGRAPRLDRAPRAPGLAGRALGPARGGHLGDPRRAQGLHLRSADVLGGLRPRHPDGGLARPARGHRPLDRGP